MPDYKVIIIDDDEKVREELSVILSRMAGYKVVAEAENAVEGMQLINKHNPKIAFVDINLPGEMNGIDILCSARNNGNEEIVFFLITAYDHHLRNALTENPFSVMLKPINEKILHEKLEIVRKLNGEPSPYSKQMADEEELILKVNHLVVISNSKKISIPYHHILFIKAEGNYSRIYTDWDNQTFFVSMQLTQIENEIPEELYFRTHRSFTVFKNRIAVLNKDQSITLRNNPHPISPLYSRANKSIIEDFITGF